MNKQKLTGWLQSLWYRIADILTVVFVGGFCLLIGLVEGRSPHSPWNRGWRAKKSKLSPFKVTATPPPKRRKLMRFTICRSAKFKPLTDQDFRAKRTVHRQHKRFVPPFA